MDATGRAELLMLLLVLSIGVCVFPLLWVEGVDQRRGQHTTAINFYT